MKSHIIGFLLVTLAQIPMPIKIGTTFQNKLLPSGERGSDLVIVMMEAVMVGRYIMRKMGTLGLLTGTQVFKPSQFRDKVVRV